MRAPEEIAQAEPPRRAVAGDGTEWSAIVLLLIGGFFAGIGWIVGVVLLWRSRVWTLRDKLIGTLLWPGGLVTAMVFASSYLIGNDDGNDLGVVAVIAALLVPVATAAYLSRRAKHSSTS
jgi:hypothetical protein